MTDYIPENRIQEEVERLQQLRANIHSNEARLKEERDELLEMLDDCACLLAVRGSSWDNENHIIARQTENEEAAKKARKLIAKVEK